MTSLDTAPDRRAELKARHRLAILDAADALIRERGKPQFSVDELAERADVSRRTVFNHFSSLDEVVLTTCTRVLGDVVEEFRAATVATRAEDGDRASLFADITTAIRAIDLPSVVAYLWGVLTDDTDDGRLHHPLGDVFSRATDQISAEIAESGTDVDEFEVAVLLGSLMNGIAIVADRWVARTGGTLDAASRTEWDGLLDRLITTLRVGYSASP